MQQQQPSPLSGQLETIEDSDSAQSSSSPLWAGRGGRPVSGYTVFSKWVTNAHSQAWFTQYRIAGIFVGFYFRYKKPQNEN